VSVIDDQDEPNSGKVKVRVFNAAPDAGTLDVYLTACQLLHKTALRATRDA
jgi:hypothetical protein